MSSILCWTKGGIVAISDKIKTENIKFKFIILKIKSINKTHLGKKKNHSAYGD